jgi:hypothetical protein
MRVREVLLTRRTLLVAVGGALGVVLLVLFGWFWAAGVPALYRGTPGDDNARLSAISTTRVGLLAGFVGIGALGTLWLNNRVYRITARTFQLTEQGQLADRYTKAIGQIGDDKLDIRLGGIYALERIAVDSLRDHPTVVEVLSAFVRERTASIQKVRPSKQRTAHPPIMQSTPKGTVDIQAAVTVLGSRCRAGRWARLRGARGPGRAPAALRVRAPAVLAGAGDRRRGERARSGPARRMGKPETGLAEPVASRRGSRSYRAGASIGDHHEGNTWRGSTLQ